MPTLLSPYTLIDEPELSFHATERDYHSPNPIQGLNAWGPFDASVPGCLRPNPLRLAILSPERSFGMKVTFLKRLMNGVPKLPNSKDEYVTDWPGFRQVFQTNIEFPTDPKSNLVGIVPEEAADEARSSTEPEVAFLEILKKHIRV